MYKDRGNHEIVLLSHRDINREHTFLLLNFSHLSDRKFLCELKYGRKRSANESSKLSFASHFLVVHLHPLHLRKGDEDSFGGTVLGIHPKPYASWNWQGLSNPKKLLSVPIKNRHFCHLFSLSLPLFGHIVLHPPLARMWGEN